MIRAAMISAAVKERMDNDDNFAEFVKHSIVDFLKTDAEAPETVEGIFGVYHMTEEGYDIQIYSTPNRVIMVVEMLGE